MVLLLTQERHRRFLPQWANLRQGWEILVVDYFGNKGPEF